MTRIGLLSDTHGYLDDKILDFFGACDEIWHAGDLGNIAIADVLSREAKFRAVYGNIDGTEIRTTYPEHLKFTCERVNIWMTHIGGYPGNYDRRIRKQIRLNPPGVFISGHSHILKVMHDKELNLLHINPGAAGKQGFHKVRTAVRFFIDNERIKNLEVLELKR